MQAAFAFALKNAGNPLRYNSKFACLLLLAWRMQYENEALTQHKE